jgi:hypothetical protein
MTPTEARLQIRGNGFHPVVVNGKAPVMDEWGKKFDTNAAEIELWASMWPYANNTGIIAKFTPGLDIDILDADAAEAVEALAREHFEERGAILVRTGLAPKRLVPLRTDEPFKILRCILIAPNGDEHKIEILGDGQQWVARGIHPDTGEPYRWHGGTLETTKREELPYVRRDDMQAFLDDAARLLVEQFNYVLKTEPDDGAARAPGEPQAPADRIAFALAVIPNNEDWHGWNNIGMAAWRATGGSPAGFTAFDAWSRKSPKYDRDITAAKWDAYFKSPPTQVGAGSIIYRAYKACPTWWLDYQAKHNPPPPDPPPSEPPQQPEHEPQPAKPKAVPLFDPWERFIVPEFPLDVLSPVLREFAVAQSRVIGACPAAMAMATLASVSAATNHGFSLKMMEHGQWYEHPRLWVLIVGDPSQKKTPEIDAATAPLERVQAEIYRDYKEQLRQYEAAGEDREDEDEPEPPPRHVVIDTTVQKLGEILARRGANRGLLVKRDELTGWIGEMDKYNKATRSASDRAFWLQSWNGGHYHVDRVGRGENFIENLSVSILGGIQPDRLAELQGLTSDGLLQRFLPVMQAEASFTLDEPADVHPYWELIRRLVSLPPQRLSMTETASRKITDLRRHLFSLEKASGGIARGFQSFIGKLAGYSGRLALVLHLTEFPDTRFIGGKVAENVHQLVVDFLIPHAFEFYSLGETGDQLKRLASYILTCDKDRILASDLTTNIRDLRGLTLFQVQERASPLVAGGWLDPVDRTPTCKAWWVNPAVKLRFAEQERKEADRKRAITEMLRTRRAPSV